MKSLGRIKKTACILLVVMTVFAGCNKKSDVIENTYEVDKNMKITSTIIEDFAQSYYDEDELESMIDSSISEYNSSSSGTNIEKKSFSTANLKVTLKMVYNSWEDYAAFNDVQFFAGTIAEALEAGYDFNDTFLEVSGGKLTGGGADSETIKGFSDYKVVIFQEYGSVSVTGKIAYISDDLEISSEKLARLRNVTTESTSTIVDGETTAESESESDSESAAETEADLNTTTENYIYDGLVYVIYQ